MAHTISKTGGPTVELGVWVAAQNNPAYTALMSAHSAALEAGTQPEESVAFNDMVNTFLAATNQEIVQ